MPVYEVRTPPQPYLATVENGVIRRAAEFVADWKGRLFVVTTHDVWQHAGQALEEGLADRAYDVLYLPGGESRKRLAPLETLAEEMVDRGADRASLIFAYGGGIVTDMGGFLAAIFMRGIPVIQAPTTLLAQVDAAIGGKTGVNLTRGKNLIGSFHQPQAVLIDPELLATLPDREYRAGLYEVLKHAVIADPALFHLLREQRREVLVREPRVLEHIIGECVRIKAEVVSADERESGLRRILNFGHTFGHALEAETGYTRLLHGEAVAWGMHAATHLARLTGHLAEAQAAAIHDLVTAYGPIPGLDGVRVDQLQARMASDKKTVLGRIHFVLPVEIGATRVVSGVEPALVRKAIELALA